MSQLGGRDQAALRQLGAALMALAAAALVGSPALATTRAASSRGVAANAAQLCALVIKINTEHGTMKNKHFLSLQAVPFPVWKGLVDAAVTERSHLLAVAPSNIKKALTDELAWFARIKANHYSKTTPLGSWTVAEVGQITGFEQTKCGIKF